MKDDIRACTVFKGAKFVTNQRFPEVETAIAVVVLLILVLSQIGYAVIAMY